MQWGLWLYLWPLAEELSWAAVPVPLSLSLDPTLLTVCPAGLLVETSAPHVTAGAGTMRQPHCRGVPTVQNASPATAIASVSFGSQRSEIQEGLRRTSIGPPCSELVSVWVLQRSLLLLELA